MLSIFYIILALLGLGFLIFIHELGHYFMARRVGMKVEAFSIGFGKPLRVWEWHGVKWQICLLPFGGYVRIAGMEKKGALEPHQIPEGFFGKKPFDRIKVALMGPIVNLAFALVAFSIIWAAGGRVKPFSEYTRIIGWVDPQSKLSQEGLTPGDQFCTVDGAPVANMTDLIYAVIFHGDQVAIDADQVDYWTGQKKPFCFSLFKDPSQSIEQQVGEIRSIQPATFLRYDRQKPLESGSPMENSGINFGDRIVWADGEIVFSMPQLSSLINQPRVLLTVQRNNQTFLVRVPRMQISDMKLTEDQKAELDDWRSESKLDQRLSQLYFIPYNLSNSGIVEKSLTYIDESSQQCLSFDPLVQGSCSPLEKPLMPGDRILAVDGTNVTNSFDLLRLLQERKILVAVAHPGREATLSWKDGDAAFTSEVDWKQLKKMVDSIGTQQYIPSMGNIRFLNPVTPKAILDFPQSKGKTQWLADQKLAQQQIDKIKDPQQREQARKEFEAQQKKLKLGVVLFDERVRYNPSPFVLFGEVVEQTWNTIKALVTGHITPKAMQGPVGIVHVMQIGWMGGVKEALFWMGLISLNLGILNLLPIPVLDGGHICFALWEKITKKPIKAKTMERLVIPFIILLVALLVFTTYHDLMNIFRNIF